MIKYLISPLLAVIQRIQRSKLRRIMRGYRILKQTGRLGRISMIQQALTEYQLDLARESFLPVVLGCGAASGEIVVRQNLLVRIGGVNLNRALLLAMGKEQGCVVYPLPKEWRKILIQHGFEVAEFWSAVLWQLYICAFLFYGIVKIFKTTFAGIRSQKNSEIQKRRYAYFAELKKGNLPADINRNQSHDVISWYLQWPGREVEIEAVCHSVANSSPVIVGNIEIKSQNRPLHFFTGWKPRISFLVWGGGASIIAALDCLRGHWWHALLLNEAALAAQVRELTVEFLAREYLFHNSNWVYRPLWTYEVERLGSKVTLYFYSTNCEGYKQAGSYPPIHFGYKSMNWPRYLVWDVYQANFVKRAVGEQAKISVVGPIWFQSSAIEMPVLDRRGIAIFDITPHRASRYCQLGDDSGYFVPAVVNTFLEDVSNSIQRQSVLMLWKRKRNIGRLAHPQYRNFASKLAESSHIVLIEPDISAIRVIETSVAVISMPFTSTALIAREMGKPSVYYDPTGLVQKDDRAAHGIEVLSNSDELNNWMSAVLGTGNLS